MLEMTLSAISSNASHKYINNNKLETSTN